MKKLVATLLILLSVSILIVINLPPVAKLKSYPTIMLTQESRLMQMKIDAVSIAGLGDNQDQKMQLRKEKGYYEIELARRTFMLDWVAFVLALMGIAMFALNFISKVESTRKVFKVRVIDMMPTENYVDEQEYYRKSQDGFTTKDEALLWYETDPMRICNYCGATAVKPVKGQKDQIQLITFYKKVPQSAKDLRIVLGTHWFVHPASDLQCTNCEQKVIR